MSRQLEISRREAIRLGLAASAGLLASACRRREEVVEFRAGFFQEIETPHLVVRNKTPSVLTFLEPNFCFTLAECFPWMQELLEFLKKRKPEFNLLGEHGFGYNGRFNQVEFLGDNSFDLAIGNCLDLARRGSFDNPYPVLASIVLSFCFVGGVYLWGEQNNLYQSGDWGNINNIFFNSVSGNLQNEIRFARISDFSGAYA